MTAAPQASRAAASGVAGSGTRPGRLTALRGRVSGALRLLDRPLTSYYLILGCSLLLLALGLVMVLSASSIEALQETESSYTLFVQQVLSASIGLPLMWIASRLPPPLLRKLAYPALFVAVALLSLTLVPGLQQERYGAHSWVKIGSFGFQPSEPAKLALVVWGADLLARKHRMKLLGDLRHLLIPLLPGAGLLTLLVLLGGDLGTALIFMAVLLALLWVAGAPLRLFAGMVGLVGIVVSILTVTQPYRMDRITNYLHPFQDPMGQGYQAVQAVYAMAYGGLFGVGLGASREKWLYLPNPASDFIFAIIGEELGLAGTLVVLVLLGLLAYAGLRVAQRCRPPFQRLAAAGVTTWIIVQAFVNIGGVIGVIPITGIPLPLVSYGGSALVTTLTGLGMLLSFARREPGAKQALAARGPGLARRVASRVRVRTRRQ